MNLSPEDALECVLETAKACGASQADAHYEESESLSLDVFEGRLKNLERSDSAGLGLRVFVEGRPGYSFTERLTRDSIRRCAEDAVALSAFTDRLELELPGPQETAELDLELLHPESMHYGPARMLAQCLEAESAAREADSRIVNIPHLGASRASGYSLLANSRGVRCRRRSASVSLGLGVVARGAGGDKMGWDGISWRHPDRLAPRELAHNAVERAVGLLGAQPIPAGSIPVLFDQRISAQFLSIFLGSFLADSVQKGQSRLVGKLDQKIATSGFRLSTAPHLPGMSGSRWFDAEGLPSRGRDLVSDGFLRGFLHNLETASREGIPSTGDAVRGYTGRVGAGFSNLQVGVEGGLPDHELGKLHPRFLRVVKLEGSTGCNPVSGEISIGVQGFLHENGSVSPVDRVSLSGNFFDLLPQIEAWGDGYRPGVHGQFVPSLLVRALQLAS